MSDQSQGPGWWLASDGRWYPPDQAPAVPPLDTWARPAGPPPKPGMSTGAKVAIGLVGGFVVLVVLSVLAVAFLGEEAETPFDRTGDASDGEVPAGYQLIEGEGVSIAVPESWDEIAPEDFAMSDEEFQQAFPNAPPEVLQQGNDFLDQGAVLVAFDTASESSSNVSVVDVPGELPLGVVEAQAESGLSTFGARLEDTGRVDLPVGEGLRVEFTLDVATPTGGSAPARGVQFFVPVDGRTYIVAITTTDDAEVADVMIDTFRPG